MGAYKNAVSGTLLINSIFTFFQILIVLVKLYTGVSCVSGFSKFALVYINVFCFSENNF